MSSGDDFASSSDSNKGSDKNLHSKEDSDEYDIDKKNFLVRRGEFDLPDDTWLQERRCLLMLLEARMLLREMVEYKLKNMRIASGNLSIAEIKNLLAVSGGLDDESDFISQIEELKRELLKEVRANHTLENNLSVLDSRIALLIQNRTSIQELDRASKKKKQVINYDDLEDFTLNKKLMEEYSHLFYALQVEPKYLAHIATTIGSDDAVPFIEFSVLTLYGDAFSPREEFLILQFFRHAIEYEVSHLTTPDITQTETILPKMFMTYTLRKQGVEYIKNTFTSLLMSLFSEDMDLELARLKPKDIYMKFVKDRKGSKKSKPEITEKEALQDPNVCAVINQKCKELQDICQQILEKILGSLISLPYGLRFICKNLRSIISDKFPKATPDQLWQILGYFVYYRFIGIAITQPDKFSITNNIPGTVQFNMVAISKVLQNLFRLEPFKEDDRYAPLNPWILSSRKRVTDYYSDLIDIPSPEDNLSVNQYMELTQKTNPMIIISAKEIVSVHQWVKDSLSRKVKDENDPIFLIIKELGEVPKVSEELGKKEIQLVLENKFKSSLEQNISPEDNLYAQTKEMIIHIFRVVYIEPGPQTLTSILKSALKAANENSSSQNKKLRKNVEKTIKNLEILTQQGVISKANKYSGLLKDIALEVSNRHELRDAQQKEIDRLKATLNNVKSRQADLKNQLSEFEAYLDTCRKNSIARSKIKTKPIKYTYKELVKRKIILPSGDGSHGALGDLKFFISMPEVGKFEIEAKIGYASVKREHLDLDDLLERKERNETELEIGNVNLSLVNTIYLINKAFLS